LLILILDFLVADTSFGCDETGHCDAIFDSPYFGVDGGCNVVSILEDVVMAFDAETDLASTS
jgi:hypothetical protein